MARVTTTGRNAAGLLALSLLLLAPTGARGAQLVVDETEPFVPDQIVVELRPEPAPVQLQGTGSPAPAPDVQRERIDALRGRHGVIGLRRAFRRFEDADGNLVRRARDGVVAQAGAPRLAGAAAAAPPVPALENVFVVELDGELGVTEAIALFLAEPDVAWAEPNWIYSIAAEPLPDVAYLPDDRYLTRDGVTWAEGAWGQAHPDLYGLRNTRALESWNAFDLDGDGAFGPGEPLPGEGVVVAVIDSGVDAAHPDLAGNVWTNPGEVPGNGIDDDGNGFVDDVAGWDFVDDDADPADPHGHGTHVAGTIAALASNDGEGVAGMAPGARILPLRGLAASGGGTAVDLAAAVDYAAMVGADITSSSWGGPGNSALLTVAFAAAEAAGVLHVSSAGNNDRDAVSQGPANLDSVMAVAAVDALERRAGFSNFGRTIEVSAPGVGVLSASANGRENAIARARPGSVVGGRYLQISGTSMACPHVSGAAAVLMGAYPDEGPMEIRGRLMAGARSLDATHPELAGRLGAGHLDLRAALATAPAPVLRLSDASARGLLSGERAEVTVLLRNFWAPVASATARLESDDPDVAIVRGAAALGAIDTGAWADNGAEPFLVDVAADAPFGPISFRVVVETDGGFAATLPFDLAISFLSDVTPQARVPRGTLLPKFSLFQDYDGDGAPDILLADLLVDLFLYRNRGDGSFRRSNRAAGVPGSFSAWTSFFTDLDADGDSDIVLGGRVQDGSRLLIDTGAGARIDASAATGADQHSLQWAAALDYDGDGRLDLLGGDGRATVEAGDKGPLHLLRNRPDLVLEDRLPGSGLPPTPFPIGLGQVATLDYDDDGDTDVLLAAFQRGISLWQNEGDGTFSERSTAAFPDFAPPGLAGLAVGDCDNDGDLDVFATGNPRNLDPPSRILRNRGGVFEDAGADAGEVYTTNVTGVFRGNAFFDLDNDGDLDLFVSKDVTYPHPTLPGLEQNVVFLNDGNCRFRVANDAAFPAGVAPLGGSAAMADYDGDGDIDIYSPGTGIFGGPGGLLRNELGNRLHWLGVRLEGTISNRDAYGARVRIEAGGRIQVREIHTSPVDPSLAHFGLGADTVVERLEVRWPSGIRQEYREVAADRIFRVVEVDCGEGVELDGDGVCDVLPVTVDIEPRWPIHYVVPTSPRPVPVALIASEGFAATDVVVASLAFGPARAPALAEVCDAEGESCRATPTLEDVDGDGRPDLLAHFRPRDAGLGWRDPELCVEAETAGGPTLRGCAPLFAAPDCGLGFDLALIVPPLVVLRRRLRRRLG